MHDNKHYICTGGCEGASDTAGVCQTEDCENYKQPLVPCACTDGEHNSGDTDMEMTDDVDMEE